MSGNKESRRPGLAWLHRAALLAVLGLGLLTSGFALAWTLRWQGRLALLPESLFWPLALLLLFSTLLNGLTFFQKVQTWRRGEQQTLAMAPFRVGLDLMVVGWALYLIYLQPFSRPVLLLYWSAVSGVFAASILFGAGLARRLPARPVRIADLLLFNICLALLAAEIALRLLAAVFPSPLIPDPGSARHLVQHRRCSPGTVRFGFPCNSRGFYDEEVVDDAEKALVSLIGDSFSAGVVPHHFHYTSVAERKLPQVQIDNVGLPAIGPSEYLLLLEETLPLQPKLVVVGLFVGNDITDAAPPPIFSPTFRRLQLWFDPDYVLLCVVSRRIYRLLGEKWRSQSVQPVGSLAGEMDSKEVETSPQLLRQRYPWLADPFQEQPTFSRQAFLQSEQERTRICRPAEQSIYQPLFAELSKIHQAAGPIPFLVLLIATEFQVEDPLWTTLQARSPPPLDRDQPQKLIGQWLEQKGIPYLDLLPAFRAVKPLADGSRHLYHLRDTHLNARGNQVAGEALAMFLEEQLAGRR